MQLLPNSQHIDLAILAESGQAFRIKKISTSLYAVPTANTVFVVEQTSKGLQYEAFSSDTPQDIAEYFRTSIQIAELKKEMHSDPFIEKAYLEHGIIPLLRQDPFETVVSFIISANKHFKHICQCVDAICEQFGEKITTPYGTFSLFPAVETLANASLAELKACKIGYRAEYIHHTCNYFLQHSTYLSEIEYMSDEEAIRHLKNLLGVGDKVADCILLFAYARDLVVPYDVWLHRIMHDLYDFPESTPYSIYRAFNEKHFGRYAGWVQQTLFYHARKIHRRGTSLKETWFPRVEHDT